MNETLVTLVGNAATAVEFRETATGGMARFRFAVTPRRWDREKQQIRFREASCEREHRFTVVRRHQAQSDCRIANLGCPRILSFRCGMFWHMRLEFRRQAAFIIIIGQGRVNAELKAHFSLLNPPNSGI